MPSVNLPHPKRHQTSFFLVDLWHLGLIFFWGGEGGEETLHPGDIYLATLALQIHLDRKASLLSLLGTESSTVRPELGFFWGGGMEKKNTKSFPNNKKHQSFPPAGRLFRTLISRAKCRHKTQLLFFPPDAKNVSLDLPRHSDRLAQDINPSCPTRSFSDLLSTSLPITVPLLPLWRAKSACKGRKT